MIKKKLAKELIEFIDNSATPFHAVNNMENELKKNGFKELKLEDAWTINKKDKYFVKKNGSTIIAFTVGTKEIEEGGFRIIGTHTDSPGFKIKSNPEMLVENKYLKLNTDVYGGPILSTWFDRPLSIAGRIIIKTENPLKPREEVFDFKRPIAIIPSLAIHLSKSISNEIDPQKVCSAIIGLTDEKNESGYLKEIISKEVGIDAADIIDYESYIYACDEGYLMGVNEEFISCSRLDNLASTKGALESLIQSAEFETSAINMIACFDNEEIGSQTKQGAGSNLLEEVLERIAIGLKKSREEIFRAYENSFFISADLAHPVHPNYVERHDPTNRPLMNDGIVIKTSTQGKYTSDSVSSSIFENICEMAGVKVQKFYNISGERTGSTIGPIISTHLPIKSVDMGIPVLAMHSAREIAGTEDYFYEVSAFIKFFVI